MKTIYYRVAVSEDEEQFFLIAMEILMFNCYKDYEEIIYENGFPENLKENKNKKQNDIIIA